MIASVVFSLGRPWIYGKACYRQLRSDFTENGTFQEVRWITSGLPVTRELSSVI